MGQPVEELEKIEQAWQRVIDLLTSAAQEVDQAIATVNELFNSHKPHPALEAAVKAIEGNAAAATHAHNDVMAQIRAAKADTDYTSTDNP
jgi:hypothetical protein